MKIQNLAVIFIIIILPITILLTNYTQNRVKTLSLQSQYDSKLNGATYDAIKAYQINSYTSQAGDYMNAKMRDVNASANIFFNSLATNFSTVGYTKEAVQRFVPALVYTMYDGYYIYSPYENTWTLNSENSDTQKDIAEKIPKQESGTFKGGKYQKENSDGSTTIVDGEKQKLYGLKPYVYYSARYKIGTSTDVVITYALDNYIAIQGKVDDKPVSKYGYLLSNASGNNSNAQYNGIIINKETVNNLAERIVVNGELQTFPCKKINGTKYYKDAGGNVFSVINGKALKQKTLENSFDNDDRAIKYYKEAGELRQFILGSSLKDLKVNNLVDIDSGKMIINSAEDSEFTQIKGRIFDFDHSGGIEAEDSNFNNHRMDVIKYSVTRNLSVAISNFNNYSTVSTDFQMPKLKDTDWEKIMNNVSVISFMQGMSIGGKVYSGYSVITNTKNEDVVMEDSIYIKTADNVAHRYNEKGLAVDNRAQGIYNVNIERRTGESTSGKDINYFPIYATYSYDSLVRQNNVETDKTKKANLLKNNTNLAKIYYTALARERYSLYRAKLEFQFNE